METFSFLKYWKGSAAAALTPSSAAPDTTTTTAILSAVPQNDTETDEDDSDDEGPFFDLEFTVPDEEDANENQNDDVEGNEDNNNNNNDDSDREFNFTLSPSSPSHNLLFNSSEPNSKPHLTTSLLKSATKFRVFMLGLKKPKPNNGEPNTSDSSSASKPQQQPEQPKKKLFTVKFKFKVEEAPIVSLFTRDNSSKAGKASHNAEESQSQSQTPSSVSDEKRLMHKYLKMVNTLYVRVSRRYVEKLRLSEQHNVTSPEFGKDATPPAKLSPVAEKASMEGDGSETVGNNVKSQKQGNNIPLPAGLRVVCKHLGKSRSGSSSAAAATTLAPAAEAVVCSRRRDDSLLQQQDGIQGAILHCKKSFNASSNPTECPSSQLPRCVNDPLDKISPELSRNPTNE